MWSPAFDDEAARSPRERGEPAPARRLRLVTRSTTVTADPAAFATVYEDNRRALYRYCRSILGHDEDAQDALQTAMTRAFAALRAERRDFELRPWLFRIVHNEAVSLLRRRRPTAELEDSLASTSAVEEHVAEREAMSVLMRDLAELPERQRAALVLREFGGFGHREIAQALGCSPSAAQQAIFEARGGLARCREGREMPCEGVRTALSGNDRRVLRGRRMRAHLAVCRDCLEYQASLGRRPRPSRGLAIALPIGPVLRVMQRLLAVKATGAGAAAGGGLASGVVGQAAVVIAVVATVGAGVLTGQRPASGRGSAAVDGAVVAGARFVAGHRHAEAWTGPLAASHGALRMSGGTPATAPVPSAPASSDVPGGGGRGAGTAAGDAQRAEHGGARDAPAERDTGAAGPGADRFEGERPRDEAREADDASARGSDPGAGGAAHSRGGGAARGESRSGGGGAARGESRSRGGGAARGESRSRGRGAARGESRSRGGGAARGESHSRGGGAARGGSPSDRGRQPARGRAPDHARTGAGSRSAPSRSRGRPGAGGDGARQRAGGESRAGGRAPAGGGSTLGAQRGDSGTRRSGGAAELHPPTRGGAQPGPAASDGGSPPSAGDRTPAPTVPRTSPGANPNEPPLDNPGNDNGGSRPGEGAPPAPATDHTGDSSSTPAGREGPGPRVGAVKGRS